ncbi:hypothetical protein KKG41_02380 [Patescibacteria group bacterium]|nr:hypothetical protein [Patescibacteria group bacterium]
MKTFNSKGISTPAILLIVVVIVLAGWLVWWGVDWNSSSNENSNANKNTNSVTNTNIDMSDWTTYENSKYDYRVERPSDWFVFGEDDNVIFSSVENRDIKSPGNEIGIFVESFKSNSVTEWFTEKNSHEIEDYSPENITLDGFPAVKINGAPNISENNIEIYLPKDNILFIIQVIPANSDNAEVFNGLISTFQFIG